jgi:hypothetical protein
MVSRVFQLSQWATVSPATEWQFAVGGDFTGDGRPDVFGYHPSDRSLWVLRNADTAFSVERT